MARHDGFKKVDKIRVKSKLEIVELPLYLNSDKGEFLVELAGETFKGDDIVALRKQIGEYLDKRAVLTWQRWIEISYHCVVGPPSGCQNSYYLDDKIPKDEDPPNVKEINFQFEVFDLSSPITLAEESVHRSSRYNAREQERRRRDLRRNADDTDWEPDTRRYGMTSRLSDGEHDVSVDYIQDRHHCAFVEFTEERYGALVKIQQALNQLDHRLRTLFGHPDVAEKLLTMHGLLLGDGK